MKKFLIERLNSFFPAVDGLRYVLKNEGNAKIHLIATILVVIFGIYFKISFYDWALIFLSITLVWFSEIINTSIEKLTDLIKPDFHPVAKIIKDLAASSVLIAAIFSVIIGLMIFLPKIYQMLN